jgi:hypothetical protein
MRAVRRLLRAIGLLVLLDRFAPRSRVVLWIRSLLSIYDAVDLLQLDVPWWTFRSADRVEAFLATRRDAVVLEWGAGASSRWLAARASTVVSIEHDAPWAETVRPLLPANCDLRVVPAPTATGSTTVVSHKEGSEGLDFGAYVAAVDDVPGEFDLIVVDGRAREACYARALDRLAPDGMIVFDNVDRQRYVDAIEASHRPVEVLWTRGLTPSLPYPTRTALIRLAAH